MAPIALKKSASSAQGLTRGGAPDARGLVRDAVRATLASPPLGSHPPLPQRQAEIRFGPPVDGFALDTAPAPRVLCCEEIDGRRWSYVVDDGGHPRRGSAVRAVPMQSPMAPLEELMSFVRSYVVPEGFPDSVTPSYVPYMTWRALKYFFGGAMGVFTTRTLLNSVGVSKNRATSGAIAINWILKDGAGRVGKMLFARQGKKFDYDLKQLRFAGDLLMELGAGVELATAAVPHLFLPLACAANVVKNVAAVTSTSTRTPIYKAYAKGENIGDVTAKGESVGNMADLLGTGLCILISKRNPSLVASFAFLSCGYVFSAYQEVKSIVLNTLNRARFTVAVDSFIKTGHVPSLKEGNSKENIFCPPWSKHTPVVLGPRFCDAFQEPTSFIAIESLFEKERYMVTYNPSKDKIYALLKDQAKSDDILKAAFHAHVLLYFIRLSNTNQALKNLRNSNQSKYEEPIHPTNADFLAHMVESSKIVSSSYAIFKRKAAEQGWIMSESLLNPGRARLFSAKEH
ncbi:Vitamin B6 photo-protection and homoeostasis [Musa troglodytarum]|uniref:Vitamin B6 photo-protection and homoeostasis n=1 Tax=Musa troglodytarum TaxID=320322 RepID=A0A9E7KM94_9LILI|nr:Vitamin B6 photo-protection and homoeostasis [Musa troglodytarum]